MTVHGKRLTAAVFITVISTVIVPVTLPLRRDACALAKCTDRTSEVISPTGAFGST